MGRFRAEAVTIKRVDDLIIVFYDKKSIYIKDDKHGWTVFHRWYAPLGSYTGGWQQFRHLLFYEKRITFNHCYRLAFRWDITHMAGVKAPNLDNKPIIERNNNGMARRCHHESNRSVA